MNLNINLYFVLYSKEKQVLVFGAIWGGGNKNARLRNQFSRTSIKPTQNQANACQVNATVSICLKPLMKQKL